MEKTKSFLDYYYSHRTLGSDKFAFRDPCDNELKKWIKFFPAIPMPKLTNDGYRIIIGPTFKISNLPKISYILSAGQIQLEVMLKSDLSKGFIIIFELSHANMSICTFFLAEIMKLIDFWKKSTVIRFKEVYLINSTPTHITVFNVVKQYATEKMMGRVHMWSKKPEDLVEVFPKNILPSDFGGDERSVEELREAWYDYVVEHREWFKAEENMKADLSKRPKADPLFDEFSSFGLNGTFRKINLD